MVQVAVEVEMEEGAEGDVGLEGGEGEWTKDHHPRSWSLEALCTQPREKWCVDLRMR